jgi:hypothetical protein
VIPLLTTTRQIRSKIKETQQNPNPQAKQEKEGKKSNANSTSKGDYIDFEEIK